MSEADVNFIFILQNIFNFYKIKLKISEFLGLSELRNREWSINKTSAIKGVGIKEGMEWLSQILNVETNNNNNNN